MYVDHILLFILFVAYNNYGLHTEWGTFEQ